MPSARVVAGTRSANPYFLTSLVSCPILSQSEGVEGASRALSHWSSRFVGYRMHIVQQFTLAALLVLAGSGCAAKQPEAYARLTPTSVEVVTIEDQARDAVAAVPTEFLLVAPESGLAWSRARDFFGLYAKSRLAVDSETLLSDRGRASGRFFYEIERSPTARGTRFSVRCFPVQGNAIVSSSIQNARNVARFLRDGVLELSLLER